MTVTVITPSVSSTLTTMMDVVVVVVSTADDTSVTGWVTVTCGGGSFVTVMTVGSLGLPSTLTTEYVLVGLGARG